MSTDGRRVLVIDADATAADAVRETLARAGCDVTVQTTGHAALALATQQPFDLIVLELVLPDLSGITVCRGIRSSSGPSCGAPILLASAQDMEADKVLGFESGADDFVTKPLDVRELAARAIALLRQRSDDRTSGRARMLSSRDLVVDLERREVTLRGTLVILTRQEFDLVALLLSRRGLIFSREALAKRLQRSGQRVTPRSVDAAVSRLRRKIERNPRAPELIVTAWGAGYAFAEAD